MNSGDKNSLSQRAFIVWCGLGSGAAALFWMCRELLLTDRTSELVLIALMGSVAMGLLARQARRGGSGFGGYFGFTVSALCFMLAVLVLLEQVSV